MPDARAIVRIGAMPDSSLRKALANTVSAAARAGKQAANSEIQAAKQAEREKIRASKAAEKAALQAGKSAIKVAQEHQRAVQKASAAEARAAQQAARQRAREAEKLAREEVKWAEWAERLKYKALIATSKAAEREGMRQRREAEKTARAQLKDQRDSRRKTGGRLIAAGGAVAGLAVGAVDRARSFAGAFGARGREEMAASALSMRRRLAILGDMGGVDAKGQAALQTKILQTSARTGVSAEDLLAGLERAQDKFTALKNFAGILDQVAEVAVATGTDVDSVVGAMGVMRRQFQLTDEEMVQLSGAMVSAADLGNVSFQEVADNFASALGGMARNANLQGMQGAITALALSQTMGAADKSASETATLINNMMTALAKPEVRLATALPKSDGGFGVKLSENGAIRDLPTIIRELSAAGFTAPENSQRRYEAFKDKEAREAFEVLVTQWERDPETVNKLLGMQTEEGSAAISRRFAAANEGVLGQAATLGARQFQTFMESGEFERFVDVTVKSADSLAQLEAQYPLMTEAVGLATRALQGFALALVAERVLMGGKALLGLRGAAAVGGAAAAGGAGAVGAAAGGTAAAGTAAAVGGASLGAMVAGGAAAGLAGYFGTKAILDVTGASDAIADFGGQMYGGLHGNTRRVKRGMPAAPPAEIMSRADEPWSVNLPPMPAQASAASAPQATLLVKIDGPGHVASVSSSGYDDVQTMSMDTGRRTALP